MADSGNFSVFINYGINDRRQAIRLAENLRSAGFDVFMDIDLTSSSEKGLDIRKAIRNSRYFIALLSRSSVQGKGSHQAYLRIAKDISTEFPENDIYLIPARLDDCNVPEFLKEIQYVDLFPDSQWQVNVNRIIMSMGGSNIENNKLNEPQIKNNNLGKIVYLGEGKLSEYLEPDIWTVNDEI